MYSVRSIASHMLSIICILASLTVHAGATETLTVNDPRPIAEAVRTLEYKYGYVITYEDPRYIHPDDLQDTHRHTTAGKRIFIPRETTLTLDLPPVVTAQDMPV